MPGRARLAQELGVSVQCVKLGLQILEHEGLLVAQGHGKRRKILLDGAPSKPQSLRIGIFPFDPPSMKMAIMVDLRHQLAEAGHTVNVMPKSLTELGMKVPRIARVVQNHEIDAWILVCPLLGVVKWFTTRSTPAFAFFGGNHELAAGAWPKKRPAIVAAVNRLISLGHRRIIFIARPEHIHPKPGMEIRVFSETLASHGIAVSGYHLPIWDESREGLKQCLDSLFAITPPTALIIDEPELFLAARQHLSDRGFVAPRDVSLICTDPDRAFSWQSPTVSHIAWSSNAVVRRVMRWASNISQGKDDRRKTYIQAKFIEGGTIGPAV